jgi:hypothetical protein
MPASCRIRRKPPSTLVLHVDGGFLHSDNEVFCQIHVEWNAYRMSNEQGFYLDTGAGRSPLGQEWASTRED